MKTNQNLFHNLSLKNLPAETSEFFNFANHLADIATAISKRYFRKPNQEVAKSDDSPVTLADREIEAAIRQEIFKNFPTHGIIGEEFGNYQEDAEYVWIIDPIDGTSSFIVGRPIFGNLIALRKKNLETSVVILGIMNQPITNERWVGIEGFGSFFNQQKIQTRPCNEISDAILCTSSPFFFVGDDKILFEKLCAQAKYQHLGGAIYGGDCYSYACLASGFVDIIIEPGLKIYDFAAHLPIIKNAGGVVSDWNGDELKLESGAKLLACGNKILHQNTLEFIRSRIYRI